MTEHKVAAEVHAISSCGLPSVVEVVCRLEHEAHVLMRLCERVQVGSPSLLPCGEGAVRQAVGRLSVKAQVERHEAVVVNTYLIVGVVYR